MEFVVWGVLLLTIAAVGGAFVWSKLKPTGRAVAQPPSLPVIGLIPDFALTNQNGQAVTLADLRGKVWIADIIFTRCAGPCPRMTRQTADLQSALPVESPIKFVTLTTDPTFDTPEVLKKYAAKFNANPERWMFLTGTKTEIGRLAIDGLKLTAIETKPEERADPADLFIHSTIFVVVDKQGRLRGVFETEGEGVDTNAARAKIITAAQELAREKSP
jgi:cytochrome oxidase Cu insertion factor (SCO1/SenC/PrrC family)